MADTYQTDLERLVLANLLMEDTRNVLVQHLTEDCFTWRIHQSIFQTIKELVRSGGDVTPSTILAAVIPSVPREEKAKALAHVFDIFDEITLRECSTGAARVLFDEKLKRDAYAEAERVVSDLKDGVRDPVAVMQRASEFYARATNPIDVKQRENALQRVARAIELAKHSDVMSIPTGLRGWDAKFGGLHKGAMALVLGHAGVSKTGLALDIAWRVAKQGFNAVFFSTEEAEAALRWRVFSNETNVPITAFRKGLTEQQEAELIKHQKAFIDHKLDIIDNCKTFEEIASQVAAYTLDGGVDFVVIDNATYVSPRSGESEVEKAKRVGTAASDLAKENNCAVMVIGHVNAESMKNKAGLTSAYGGQGLIMPATMVCELRRNDEPCMNGLVGITMHVSKNRYGETGGDVNFAFEGERMRYHDA